MTGSCGRLLFAKCLLYDTHNLNNMENGSYKPLVSVVIPVKNGAATIRECMQGIFSQTLAGKTEVIVIDSGSNDGTMEILKEYPVIVRSIRPEDFSHGNTRNLGASLASGELIVFTVQDAVPAGNTWLETLIKHFEDPSVSGVCGQQIVAHDPAKNPLQWFRPASLPEVRRVKVENFSSLPNKTKHQMCRWDNVNAAYRRSTLRSIPFRNVSFGEDALWAHDALQMGHTLVYDYNARVFHYHHQDFSFYFRRSYIILYQDYRYFNFIQPGSFLPLNILRTFYSLFRMKLPFKQKVSWANYNLKLILARSLARWTFRGLVIFTGKNGIDRGLRAFCGQIPQGRQNNLITQLI